MPPGNPYNKYIKQYQASNINTATPEKLMILLFDGALQFLQKAKTAIAENNLQERAQNIEGARKIIRELMRTSKMAIKFQSSFSSCTTKWL